MHSEKTIEQNWLDTAHRLADTVIPLYFDHGMPLPRAATGIDYCEGRLMPPYLLHGLARMVLLSTDRKNCPLAADMSQR